MPAMTTILPSAVPVIPASDGATASPAAGAAPLNGALPSVTFADAFAQLHVVPDVIAMQGGVTGALADAELASIATAADGAHAGDGGLGQWLGLVLPPDGTSLPDDAATAAQAAEAAAAAAELAATQATDLASLPSTTTVVPATVAATTLAQQLAASNAMAMAARDERLAAGAGEATTEFLLSTTATPPASIIATASSSRDGTNSDAPLFSAPRPAPSIDSEQSARSAFDTLFFNTQAAADAGSSLNPRGLVEHVAPVTVGTLTAVDANNTLRASANMVTTTVPTPMHNPQWSSDVGERLVYLVKQDIQHAEIRLNPAHMGPIEVRLTMQNDQAHLTMTATHSVTRDALEAALPKLREMFADAGVTLNGASVTGDTFADQRQREQNASAFAQSDQRQSDGFPGDDLDAEGEWQEMPLMQRDGSVGGLDVFA